MSNVLSGTRKEGFKPASILLAPAEANGVWFCFQLKINGLQNSWILKYVLKYVEY